MKEYNKFKTKIWKQGNSLIITIPKPITEFEGYKEGDTLKVMIKKENE